MAFGFSFKRILNGLNLIPSSSSNNQGLGDIEVLTSDNKAHFHNGTSSSPVVTEAHTATLTNKTLSGNTATNLVSGSGTFTLNTSGTITAPNATDTLVGKATTDTLTNKTLSGNTASSLVNGAGTINFNSSGTITVPNTTDTLVGKATTDTLTNKTLTSPTINTPTLNGSGGALTLPAGPDTLVGRATTDTLTNKTLTSPVISTISNSGTLTLPTSTDTLVGRATTDTLTNKTWGDAPTYTQVATPSNPSASKDKLYFKSDDNLYTLNSSGTESKVLTNINSFTAPTIQKFTSTGTTTGYLFNISTTSTCTAGDTYTNNAQTFTVLGTISALNGPVLFCTGTGSPSSSGTLTRSTGSGTSSIAFTSFVPLATYTTPVGTLFLKVKLIGGGGGGSGSGTSGAGGIGTGGTTVFGTNLLKGFGGVNNGGIATIASPAYGTAIQGGTGGGFQQSSTSTQLAGGQGAAGPWGGNGNGVAGTTGGAAIANSGSGGGGGGIGAVSSGNSGAGGGSGGYLDAIIPNPSGSYFYAIGAGGSAGSAGTSGSAGGAGGTGYIEVTEYYQ